jgi:glycosyltransferase involved in cell wall biosynthesis
MRALFVASELLGEEMRGAHEDIRVIAPGRDPAAAAESETEDLRRGRKVAYLCVGNWVARKGIIELVDAFAALSENAGTLHLVGDDAADTRYATKVQRRLQHLGDRVVVHGVLDKERVAAMYRDADVFVMPSRKEPYGTVYGEAMAAGLPVVGWRAGNLPYLVDHSKEGFVLDPGDVPSLRAALQLLADDGVLREGMADAARIRGAGLPTWEQTAATFFAELRDLI